MTASADSDRTILLILPTKKQLYPLSTAAFRQAQASRRQLAGDYRDALILDRDGALRRIEAITVEGALGDSLARKVLSRLTNAWRISVQLSDPLAWSLDELKQLVVDCIDQNGSMGFPELDEEAARQALIRAVLAASNAERIIASFPLPPPEDALDVL